MTVDDGSCLLTSGLGSRLLPVVGGDLAIDVTIRGLTGALLARRLGLATPQRTATGSLAIEQTDDGERWTRTFGGRTWISMLTPGADDTVDERAGVVRLRFEVRLDADWNTRMTLRSTRVGPISLPPWRGLDISACISPDSSTLVTITVPGGSCTYSARFIDGADSTEEAAR